MKSIALIGFMGSGKSTVGPLVADRIGLPWLDLDSAVEKSAGMTVSEVFSTEGEAGWRRRESLALKQAVEGGPVVLACGGGIILSADNRDVLRHDFLTIYLEASETVLISRLRRGKGRPLLEAADREAAIGRLLEERRSLYESVAHIIIDTDTKQAKEVADEAAALAERLEG